MKNSLVSMLILALFLSSSMMGFADESASFFNLSQNTTPQTYKLQAEKGFIPSVTENYMVDSGDIFGINFFAGKPIFVEAVVSADGYLILPNLSTESIYLRGKELGAAKQLIQKQLQKDFPNSTFQIYLITVRQQALSIRGAVAMPGVYQTTADMKLATVLDLAGGRSSLADLSQVQIFRNTGIDTVNLLPFFLHEDIAVNQSLGTATSIFIPVARQAIQVHVPTELYGTAVNNLDQNKSYEIYSLPNDQNLLNHIFQIVAHWAPSLETQNLFLVRDKQGKQLSLHNISEYEFMAGDKLFFAQAQTQVFVRGAVKVQGAYPYMPNANVLHYVGIAGEAEHMAEKFYIIDANGNKRRVKWDAVPLPGETIEVKQNWIPLFRDIVSPVATVATVIISIINVSQK